MTVFTTVHYLMGHSGPKQVEVCVLTYYCNSNEVCAFVGLHFDN